MNRHLLRRARSVAPDLCFVVLRLAGWGAVTLLAAAGCLVLAFLMLGGFTAEGFFANLDNLASRFAAADAGRRERFLDLVLVATTMLAAAVAACRWRSLAASLTIPEEPRRG
jgi:hypothetical protein